MKKIIIIAVVALVAIAAIAAGLFMFVFNKKDTEAEKQVTYQEFALDDMYCNIMNTNKILKVKIVIQFTDEKLKEKLEKEFKSKIVNDASEYLRSRTLEQLSTTNGQKRMREDLLEKVKAIVETEDGVTDVFFTDYIIQ